MSGKLVGFLVTIAVVAVGGVLVLSGKDEPAPTPAPAPVPTATPSASASVSPQLGPVVRYSSSGFTPQTVTIKVGQSVTFINDTSEELQVASDPHPIHTNLGGFDSKKNVGQGQTYTFTFNKKGEWGFHNHDKSSMKGKVIVQ